MSGSNPNYSGSAAEILNVDYAAGWAALALKTLNATGGATTSVELDYTIRTIWIQGTVPYHISFTKVATDISTTTDLILQGNSSWWSMYEFKVPRGIVGNDKKASVFMNVLGYDVAGSLRMVKG